MAQPWCRPAGWWPAAEAARRTRGNVPPALTVQSTPPGAAALWPALAPAGRLPCPSVGAAGREGQRPAWRDAVATGVGLTTCVALPAAPRGGLQRPRTAEPPDRAQGEARSQWGGGAPADAAWTVATGATPWPAARGSQRPGAAGTPGPRPSAGARHRLTRGQEGRPERPVGLVSTRPRGEEPTEADARRQAPGRTPRRPLVGRRGRRWAVEQGGEAGQPELGLDPDAGRPEAGGPHQRRTPRLAPGFVWPLPRRWGHTSPSPDRVAAAPALRGRLPPTA